MASKSHTEWLSDRAKKIGAVIAFGGSERARVDGAVQEVRKLVLTQAPDFNHDRLNGAEADCSDIISLAKTVPMMAERRLIEVRQADALKGDLTSLVNYLASPCQSSVLLFIFDQIDQRLKLPKALQSQKQLYVFDAPKEYEMAQLIERLARQHKLKLSSEASLALALIVGTDISLLENALRKLIVAVPAGVISGFDIEKYIKNEHVQDVFSFGRLIISGQAGPALTLLCRLNIAQEVPLKLVGLLAWQFRQVVRCRSLQERGFSDAAIEKQLVLFGKNKELLVAAKKQTLSWHIQRLSRLSALDQDLKSKPGSAWLHFEQCMIELCT